MGRGLRAVCCALGAGVVLATSSAATAQPSPTQVATAQALFDDAKGLMQARRFAEACPKLEESERLDPGPGTKFHLADCYAKLGRSASAWATFMSLADEMKAAGQHEREQVSRAHAAALEPGLSKLVITVPPTARLTGLAVTRDGEPVKDVLWGIAVPVDPGVHQVTASAPRHAAWRTDVTIKSGVLSTTVTVPALSEGGEPAAATPPAASAASAPSPTNPASTPTPTPTTGADSGSSPARAPLGAQRIAAIVAAGVGVVSLGVGGAFGFVSMSKHSDYTSHCPNDACDATGLQLHDQAVSAGNVSTVFFIVGGVAVAAGAVLWLTAPSTSRPAVGLTANGVVLRGAW